MLVAVAAADNAATAVTARNICSVLLLLELYLAALPPIVTGFLAWQPYD